MRRIVKGAEPPCLTAERAAGRQFDEIVGGCKQLMRDALIREQRGLCCYCMSRIVASESGMRVEHLVPQSDPIRGAALAMNWSNLFGSCDGGRGKGQQSQHCDASKGDQLLSFGPTIANVEDRIRYRADGDLDAEPEDLKRDLVEVLRLNTGYLPSNRNAALAGFLEAKRRRFPGPWDRNRIDTFLAELTKGREMRPFIGVIVHFLMKRRARS